MNRLRFLRADMSRVLCWPLPGAERLDPSQCERAGLGQGAVPTVTGLESRGPGLNRGAPGELFIKSKVPHNIKSMISKYIVYPVPGVSDMK